MWRHKGSLSPIKINQLQRSEQNIELYGSQFGLWMGGALIGRWVNGDHSMSGPEFESGSGYVRGLETTHFHILLIKLKKKIPQLPLSCTIISCSTIRHDNDKPVAKVESFFFSRDSIFHLSFHRSRELTKVSGMPSGGLCD